MAELEVRDRADLEQRTSRCERCELFRDATQAVVGDGPVPARVMLVGEQPGDVEDREGRPFVGPAGTLLRRAMATAGLDASDAYLTNAVKHFRWEARSTRRIHKTPSVEHVRSCHLWLEAELELVRPEVVVLLGATAARSFDRDLRVRRDAGRPLRVDALGDRQVVLTAHPSSILRSSDRAGGERVLVDHLRVAGRLLSTG